MTENPLRRILVVDDEPEILAEVVGYLRRRGESVVAASSYRQGLQALEDDALPIDILITDGRMPDGSGMDLLRAAIEGPDGPQAFILMTGHFEESDLTADLLEAGVVVMHKPFSLSALYRQVGAVWDAHCPIVPALQPAPVANGDGR